MGKALVVFGSASDSEVYSAILKGLKARGIGFEMRICSAHRTPEMLKDILGKTDADLIIAGAGLSAALPGVTASETLKLVIGVPVTGNYGGTDALLSVHQMPGGMPVLAVGVNNAEQAAETAGLAFEKRSKIVVLNKFGEEEKTTKRLHKGVGVLEELGAEFEIVEDLGLGFDPAKDILINLHPLGEELEERENALAINVPMKEGSSAKDVALLEKDTAKGAWVGLNRVENACIAAAQLLNIGNGKYTKALKSFRESQKEKVIATDKAEQEK